ncbi:uncharacterized protein [Littorina saxatilis]|uniref:uncharacterized protein n=1 Tax=Littorina saxatilis TaxID=31220 RepID=UPI0038B56EF3
MSWFLSHRIMPPKRAASRRVAEVTRAVTGRPTPSATVQRVTEATRAAAVQASTSNPGEAETGLAAVLAEMRQMAEQAQKDIAALTQDNQRLREAAARCPDTVSPAPGSATAFTSDHYAMPDGPAANLARSITGEKSHFVPVDLFVEDKLKARIWAQEAIDLATLVKGEDHGSYDITISKSADGPSFSIRDAPNKANVLSEASWTAAWNIYAAIYTQRFPTAMQGLAVHFQQVQQLMLEKGDWRGYDRAFRRMVQQGLQQWGVASPALYTSARLKFVHGAMAAPHHRGDSPAAVWQRGGRNGAPKGFCYDFHLNNSCKYTAAQCRYKHLCYKCKTGDHPASQCTASGDSQSKMPFPRDSGRGGRSTRR